MHANFDLPLPMIRHTTAPHRLWEAEPGMSDEDFAQKLADDLEAADPRARGRRRSPRSSPSRSRARAACSSRRPATSSEVQEVLRRYDVLLIADEVITGFGRLGAWFGSDVFGIEPDLITVAKGMTSGYVPLSACIVSEKVWRVLVDGGSETRRLRPRLHVQLAIRSPPRWR